MRFEVALTSVWVRLARSLAASMTPAASLVEAECPRALMTSGPPAGGAARVGATARQPSPGVTLSMPAMTLA
eukprot:9544474-Alexandrium_andersonii.AAC.1